MEEARGKKERKENDIMVQGYMVGRDQIGEGGKLLINKRMIEELFGGDKITKKSTARV